MTPPTVASLSFGAALAAATARLAEAGVPWARRDARLLLARAVGVDPARVVAYPETELTPQQRIDFEGFVARRGAREPVARILGEREFWSLKFRVTPAVLDPRPDSETLVEALLARIPAEVRAPRLLDLGTGSGCLLLALLSEVPRSQGLGTDIDPGALAVARDNARALGLDARARFQQGDWAGGLASPSDFAGPFDLVACNPPYIASDVIPTLQPEVANFDPIRALDGGADGLDAYRALVPQLPQLLAPGGWAGLEIGWDQAAAVDGLLRQAGFMVVESLADLSGHTRCLLARRPSG